MTGGARLTLDKLPGVTSRMAAASHERAGRQDCSVTGRRNRPDSCVLRPSSRILTSRAVLVIGTCSSLPAGDERPKALPERHLVVLCGQQRGRDTRKIVEFGHLIRKGLFVVGLRRYASAENVGLEATQRGRNKVRGHPVGGHRPCQARDHAAAESAVRAANHRGREIRVSYQGFAIRVTQRRDLIGPLRGRIRLTHRPHSLTNYCGEDVVHALKVVVKRSRRDTHFRGNPAGTQAGQPVAIDESQPHGDNPFAGEQRFGRSRHAHKVTGISRWVYIPATSNSDRRRSPSPESQYPPDLGYTASIRHKIAARIPSVSWELDRMAARFRILRPASLSALGDAEPLAHKTTPARNRRSKRGIRARETLHVPPDHIQLITEK
jgi:hypothetical protein